MKIAVVGIGGVGGLIGGLLAKEKSGDEIVFIAREAKAAAIRQNGLTVKSVLFDAPFTARPDVVTSRPEEVGAVDVVLIAVKTYGLEQACKNLSPLISDNTVVIPLLNGVGTQDRLYRYLNKGILLDGCIYTSSFYSGESTVNHVIELHRVFFGDKYGKADKTLLKEVERTLIKHGVDAHYSEDIVTDTWTKYLFVCAYGSAFCYLGGDGTDYALDAKKRAVFSGLIKEIVDVGGKVGVKWAEDVVEKTEKLTDDCLIQGVVPSMYRDYVSGKQTESEFMAEYVNKLAVKYGYQADFCAKVTEKMKR